MKGRWRVAGREEVVGGMESGVGLDEDGAPPRRRLAGREAAASATATGMGDWEMAVSRRFWSSLSEWRRGEAGKAAGLRGSSRVEICFVGFMLGPYWAGVIGLTGNKLIFGPS